LGFVAERLDACPATLLVQVDDQDALNDGRVAGPYTLRDHEAARTSGGGDRRSPAVASARAALRNTRRRRRSRGLAPAKDQSAAAIELHGGEEPTPGTVVKLTE
jgi:hypothetical protein